jgi:hypothetical protein
VLLKAMVPRVDIQTLHRSPKNARAAPDITLLPWPRLFSAAK